MSKKPLDCVGVTTGVGKHDFQPGGEIVHGAVQVPEASELAAVTRERDALKAALSDILNRTKNFGHSGFSSMAHFKAFADAHIEANETLAKLASGELRKLKA